MSDEAPLSQKDLCPDDLLRGQEEAFARDVARLLARKAEFTAVSCPACGSFSAEAVFAKLGFSYLACDRCQTVYMSPRPSPAVMADYYTNSENYRYWAKYIFPASETARRDKLHRPRLERIAGFCARYDVDRGLLVEVGPGFGTFAALASESGLFRRVLAVEPTPELAAACRERGVAVLEQRVEAIDSLPEPADVLVAFEVIEHLFAPREFLAGAAALLRKGGLLVLTCPNGLGFDIVTLGGAALAVDPEHVNFFNPQSLGSLVSTLGFEILEVGTPGRLDAGFVREAALSGVFDLSNQPFLKRVLVEEWDRLGQPFQDFLAANGLSSHLWLAARKIGARHG